MSKILVTGAGGCVGANLVKRLISQGHQINALLLPETWHPFLDHLKLNVFYGDITNIADVRKAMKNCEYAYQVAGVISYNLKDHQQMFNVHVNGVRNVLRVAKEYGLKKVVVTASTAGIGIPENKDEPLTEDSPFDVKKYKKVMYMYSKYLCIKECKKFSQSELNVSIVSPTNIYGQGDINMHIGKLVKRIKDGKITTAPPGGNAVVSVDDIIDAHLLVMEKGRSGENYIFANEFLTYREMFNTISLLTRGLEINKVYPLWVLSPTKLFLGVVEHILLFFNKKPTLSPHSLNFTFKYRYFNSSKARTELGWKPKVIFKEAMKKAIAFYTEYNLI